jgi:hypothetical protein
MYEINHLKLGTLPNNFAFIINLLFSQHGGHGRTKAGAGRLDSAVHNRDISPGKGNSIGR